MAGLLPKHIICSTFTPIFTPASTISLLVFNETRGRLEDGNSFFRSIGIGDVQNDISVESEWLDSGSSVTSVSADVAFVRITIRSNGDTEIYVADQSRGGGSDWSVDATDALSSQINLSSSLIEMDKLDIQQPWPPASPAGYVDNFSEINLSGGSGQPTTGPGSAVQTGPHHALIFVQNSELGQDTGELAEILEVREWRNTIGGSPFDFAWSGWEQNILGFDVVGWDDEGWDIEASGVLDPTTGLPGFDPENDPAASAAFCDTGL
jgi:hypothetical protein